MDSQKFIKQSRQRRDWGGGHANGVGRIHSALRGSHASGVTARYVNLEETFYEVVNLRCSRLT